MQKKFKFENIFAKINNMEVKKWDENTPNHKLSSFLQLKTKKKT